MGGARWIETGSFRSVLLVGDFAVKLAKNDEGVLCNYREAERSPLDKRYCPVLGCYDHGRVLVMERADQIGNEEFERLKHSTEMVEFLDYDPAHPIDVEANGRNIGRRRDGKLVYIDYGDET
jgi:hypothetical protein